MTSIEWTDAEREAVRDAILLEDAELPGTWEECGLLLQMALQDEVNAALAALAPFIEARIAAAKAEGMREAAGIAEARANALCDFGKHVRAAGAEEAAKDIRAKAAAILATIAKEPPHDR